MNSFPPYRANAGSSCLATTRSSSLAASASRSCCSARSNYVLQRTPGTFYVSTHHRGPAPLNTALGSMAQPLARSVLFLATAALLALPRAALAHGEYILFLPLGQLAALVTGVATALFLRSRVRLLVVTAALGLGAIVAFASWFLPPSSLGAWRYSAFAFFVLGFVPPALVACGITIASARRRSHGT